MMRIEHLETFEPGVEQLLFPHSAEEYLKAGETQNQLLRQSEIARAIYSKDQLLCYVGVMRASLIGTPFLWVLLGKNLTGWSARTFCKLLRQVRGMFPGLQTVVEVSYLPGHRFAKACGFSPLDQFVEVDNRLFQYYEVR